MYLDVMVCFQALEHIENSEKAISEIHCVLKKDGIIMLSTHGKWHVNGMPNDYWRWTNYYLQKVFRNFSDFQVFDNGAPGLSLFQIINLYVQRLNLFHLMTPARKE